MDFNNIHTVICHESCPDGLASALMAKDALPGVDIKFMQYNTPDHKALSPQPGILFLDFSPNVPLIEVDGKKVYNPDILRAWGESGSMVLDHHKGSKTIIDAFGQNGRFGDEATNPGVCGAYLTFKHLWEPIDCNSSIIAKVERFARLAGIRDTWVRDSPEWDEACRQADILMFMPKERWLSESLYVHLERWEMKYDWIGEVLEAKNKRAVEKSIEGGFRYTTENGTRAIIFENVKTTSDVSDNLTDVDVVIGYTSFSEGGSLKTVFSTRSRGNFNCLEFCKRHGGGGHTKAAGFSVTGIHDEHPVTTATRLLNEYCD